MSGTLETWLHRIGEEHPRGVKRGLGSVRLVAEALDVLPPAPTTIVVAGTNGKGSTVAFAERLLLAGGHSVGTTTSPHLHRFNERIRVNGVEATDADIIAAFETIEACRVDRGGTELSYFEYGVLAALATIRDARVDVAVLEVGLGGRLDAVNLVDADVAVITNIGMDHLEYLGGTREKIGDEKAGILRPGAPLVYGEPDPPPTVVERAAELGVPVHLAGRDFGHRGRAVWSGDVGWGQTFDLAAESAVDPANAATAIEAVRLAGIRVDAGMIRRAAESVHNPGRFEVVRKYGRTWILDVAHNPQGAEFLAERLKGKFAGTPLRAIVGCLADKDVRGILDPLKPLVSEFAYVDTGTGRGQSGHALRRQADDPGAFAGTLGQAMEGLPSPAVGVGIILVLGSFDVVERARIRLGLAESA